MSNPTVKIYTYAWCFHSGFYPRPIQVRYTMESHVAVYELVAVAEAGSVVPREISIPNGTILYGTLGQALRAEMQELNMHIGSLIAEVGSTHKQIQQIRELLDTQYDRQNTV